MKKEIISVNGKGPAIVIDTSDDNAIVLMKQVTEDGLFARMQMEPINVKAVELMPYECPYKDEERCYCENGICKFPVALTNVSTLMSMCMECSTETYRRELLNQRSYND